MLFGVLECCCDGFVSCLSAVMSCSDAVLSDALLLWGCRELVWCFHVLS